VDDFEAEDSGKNKRDRSDSKQRSSTRSTESVKKESSSGGDTDKNKQIEDKVVYFSNRTEEACIAPVDDLKVEEFEYDAPEPAYIS